MIKKIDISEISPSEYNPRFISDFEKDILNESINTFGLVDPIIINLKNMKIIGGHQRYNILIDKNITELNLIELGDIGWVFVNENINLKNEDEEKALNIALNRDSGEWDNNKLDDLLNEFEQIGFDIELTGFEKISDTFHDFNFEENFENDGFFNIDFNETDNIEEITHEDVTIKASSTIIKVGEYNIELPLYKFNKWLRKIELDNDFNKEVVISVLKRRLKFEDS